MWHSDLLKLNSFSEIVEGAKASHENRTISIETIRATPQLATTFQVRAGTPVLRLERLSVVNGQPTGISRHHFLAVRVPGTLAAGEAFGVWGGLGERERRQLRVGDVASPARLDIRGRTRPRSPFEHGKPGTSGYQRHLREATEPCMPCRQAAAAARALYRQQRGSA